MCKWFIRLFRLFRFIRFIRLANRLFKNVVRKMCVNIVVGDGQTKVVILLPMKWLSYYLCNFQLNTISNFLYEHQELVSIGYHSSSIP